MKRSAPYAMLLLTLVMPILFGVSIAHAEEVEAIEREYTTAPPSPAHQSRAEADAKSSGCVTCHTASDAATMHASPSVTLGCTDCHGGDAQVRGPGGQGPNTRHAIGSTNPLKAKYDEHAHAPAIPWSPAYFDAMKKAHVLPAYPDRWLYPASRNPEGSFADFMDESPEYVRFVNPGDLRIAAESCGACHMEIVKANQTSLMSTSAMLMGGASYNNGVLPYKRYILGEYYTRDGKWGSIRNPNDVTPEMARLGILEKLIPLPAWETVPTADIFRVFERGGRNIGSSFGETGLPNSLGLTQRLEEPGRVDIRQSNRGPATGSRISVPVLNIHKTRLNDPHLWFLGTNDNPGDFRSSGCTACHVTYANDRDPRHSALWAKYGNRGESQQVDPTIPRGEPGHPIRHVFTRAIPSSQCMSCHMHQPNMFINTMLGYIMWDYESDAPSMWPAKEFQPDDAQTRAINERNPEEAAIRGKWADPDFLQDVSLNNPLLKDTQFADYHGHGWNFRAVFKRDRKGHLLDADGGKINEEDPKKLEKAVHLSSIHVDVGMQCVDCHYAQDAHSNGHIVGEVAAGVEIQCQDCHGTPDKRPTLKTSGPMAPKAGRNLALIRNPDGKRRFQWSGDTLIQRSATTPGLEWQVSQLVDTSLPASGAYNVKADRAHTMSRNTSTLAYGTAVAKGDRAHDVDKMLCYTCHTSWTTSCGGCHLPIQANWKSKRNHYEGGVSRNYATYNPQVARDDLFQLGVHGEVKDYKIAPVRSSSALVLSSTNLNRERIYIQQPPISASGYSSQAFAPHYPHTERRTETKQCSDCHLSRNGDNNAIMAQLLLQGTRFADFMGFNAWVGGEGEINAVVVTEWDEPQAVIGSYLQRYAYPTRFAKHKAAGAKLGESYSHRAGVANCIQLRGEYLYVAEGDRGTQVYDVASIANKGISGRILTAPFAPIGQGTRIKSKNATCAVLATTQPVQPSRSRSEFMQKVNLEQPMHAIYDYLFIVDAEEGLIATDIDTLHDFEPRNNSLKRALTWNADGVLTGVRHLAIAGTRFYASTPRGIVVLDMDKPLQPRVVATIPLEDARAAQVQFRYLFATTRNGLEVIDLTDIDAPRIIDSARVPLRHAHKLQIARTYAYVANGTDGVAIIDITRAEDPKLFQMFNAGGAINDARDVTVATTNASPFLYVADGRNGLRVVQLMAPDTQSRFYGFSPEPNPQLVASFATKRTALAISRPLERDRAVDETGHQIAVMGRIGSRPFNAAEMRRLYLDRDNKPWFADDTVPDDKKRGIASPRVPWLPNRTYDQQVPESERESAMPHSSDHARPVPHTADPDHGN